MENKDYSVVIGSDPSCELPIRQAGVLPRHVKASLTEDSSVLLSLLSGEPLEVLRQGQELKARQLVLCVGDRIWLAGHELELSRITACFPPDTGIRLHPAPKLPPQAGRPGQPPSRPPRVPRAGRPGNN